VEKIYATCPYGAKLMKWVLLKHSGEDKNVEWKIVKSKKRRFR